MERQSDYSRFQVQCVDWLTGKEGQYLSVYLEDISSQSQKEFQRLRNHITTVNHHNKLVGQGKLPGPVKSPPLRCSFCLEPLLIRTATNSTDQYPIHDRLREGASPDCPQRSGTTLPTWLYRAIQHQGIQEGEKHFRLKHLLAQLLRDDPNIDRDSILIEKRLKGFAGLWRKPDVQAWVASASTQVAFEIQVSPELPYAIAARQYFYKLQPSLGILWILPEFSPAHMNQSQKDIQTQNEDHMFALTDTCADESRRQGGLILECWLHRPYRDGNVLKYTWENRLIGLDEISFQEGRAVVEDLKAAEQFILEEIELNKERARKKEQARKDAVAKEESIITKPVLSLPKPQPTADSFLKKWQNLAWRISSLLPDIMWPYLIRELDNGYPAYGQTLSVPGIWLRCRGIELSRTQIPPFVLKALRSANQDKSEWDAQSWPWITNEMAKDCNRRWLGPFHNLLNQSGRSDSIARQRNYHTYRAAILDVRQQGVVLNEHEKVLIKSICSELNTPPPRIMPTLWNGHTTVGYPVYQVDTPFEGALLAPDFAQEQQSFTLEGIEEMINARITERLAYSRTIPMPMLP
ncbi:DUF6035 family protein [Marinobacterium iners]|uniref:DUF6035 domain-containing protein n=1 Tax=Marinobacterium iners DSM 11526 TaxID=1122198 RepID=A0A1H4GQM8_9GAMM|nr:DUF6035 family protein [Marinobacterium iners]SEB11631.1 hypothetical protein SAMN02745729_1197 [Marinobacterium iners DSM 11526]